VVEPTNNRTVADTATEDMETNNFINAVVLDKISGKPLKYSNLKNTDDKHEWEQAEHTEWIRLVQKTETGRFMKRSERPNNCKPSYYNPQPEMKMKDNKLIHRIRGTYGVHKGDMYPEDLAAYIADLTTTKLILNKVVSTPNAKFMTLDNTEFYLGTPLKYKRYIKVHKRMIPLQTRTELNIPDEDFDDNGYIYVEISKGMYGLPEAGILAQQRLYQHLQEHQFIRQHARTVKAQNKGPYLQLSSRRLRSMLHQDRGCGIPNRYIETIISNHNRLDR
jgi:hypothetical protein